MAIRWVSANFTTVGDIERGVAAIGRAVGAPVPFSGWLR